MNPSPARPPHHSITASVHSVPPGYPAPTQTPASAFRSPSPHPSVHSSADLTPRPIPSVPPPYALTKIGVHPEFPEFYICWDLGRSAFCGRTPPMKSSKRNLRTFTWFVSTNLATGKRLSRNFASQKSAGMRNNLSSNNWWKRRKRSLRRWAPQTTGIARTATLTAILQDPLATIVLVVIEAVAATIATPEVEVVVKVLTAKTKGNSPWSNGKNKNSRSRAESRKSTNSTATKWRTMKLQKTDFTP